MSNFAITSIYAALSGFLLLVLALLVVRQRQRSKIGIGDGADKALARAIRVHGNAAEYLPMQLILLGLCEAAGLPALILHLAGVAIVGSRLLHAQGLSRSAGLSFGRFVGTLLSLVLLLALPLLLLTRPWWA